jgi:hypothetical protein
MVLDQTGALANVKRHDYLPFGEELFAPAGGRTTAMGYASGDNVRQQFTLKERDFETGLDYFLASVGTCREAGHCRQVTNPVSPLFSIARFFVT